MERGFLILDFGSQLTQLIARRLRELNHYSEVHPFDLSLEEIRKKNPYGIILSGGPHSVYENGAPLRSTAELLELAPVLGICYGMQLLAYDLGGVVEPSTHREYGANVVTWKEAWGSMPAQQNVWMSHGDVVKVPPPGFRLSALSSSGSPAAMRSERAWAVQFHPEVEHTQNGLQFLADFAGAFCQAPGTWTSPHRLSALQNEVRQTVGQDSVLCALSGGVDSTVVATLLTRTLGAEKVFCVFVDNGLLRKNEYESVLKNYQELGLNIQGVDAKSEFLTALKNLPDPEQKRKAIGRVFVEIFEKTKPPGCQWLAQGTLYPDVIESFAAKGGPSHTIKSHHNVGGLPEKMNMKLCEPVRWLFKDEVRSLGRELGLRDELLMRHPFPGPGLAIRILGEVTEEALRISREADAIFVEALRTHNLYHKIWQAFCVLLPVKTVGVQGDGRTYDQVLALRAVTSTDGMTADWYPFESGFLREVSNQITNQVRGVSRVVLDITSKPPATIEWE